MVGTRNRCLGRARINSLARLLVIERLDKFSVAEGKGLCVVTVSPAGLPA
jgi:hypothetical protein